MSAAGEKRPKLSLYDLTPNELESFFLSIGEKPFRASQVLDFLYRHPPGSFDEFTSLSKSLRERIGGIARLAPLILRTSVESSDGTVKNSYELESRRGSQLAVESVLMPYEPADAISPDDIALEKKTNREKKRKSNRITLCISSQVGCALACSFCATGAVGLKAQLTTGEIVWQVVDAMARSGRVPDAVLFMGMGEPMHNFDSVCGAVEILMHQNALGISPRRIVVSTAGELDLLEKFHEKFLSVRMAISLNASTNSLRSRIMPINEKFDLRAIRSFLKRIELRHSDRVTIEYVILGGVNDTERQADALHNYILPIKDRVKVNLIAYNTVEGKDFTSPDRESVFRLQNRLRSSGIMVFIRRNRGRGAYAACGQLAGKF
ncbi:MAG: 23S rRNA (adenine(2503)-C(2))-methyltransferase RlmN [bacterium]